MVFTSQAFVFYFLPIVLVAYFLTGRRNLVLLGASYAFYAWWNPWFVLLMLFVTLVNFASGNFIAGRALGDRRRYWALVASVTASLGMLGFFKYAVFFQENLNLALGGMGAGGFPVLQVVLPVGISFYIFQSISYSVDVYRGQAPPVRSFTDFACFVSLFPQLIAGPIIRYNTIAQQLVSRTHSLEKFSSGVGLFVLGFAKKVLLANTMGQVADPVFAAQDPTVVDAWFGVTAYAFQIYFDFAGYSDMAIGLGRMFGFEFPKNFNAPYRAGSITEFWRRWHISLSTFLRDYLYIPLGGNRKGVRRTYVNLMIVMLLGGLWHGAAWTFVAWGALHGLLLALERWRGEGRSVLPHPVAVLRTFVLVLLTWVLFRSANIHEALDYFGAMFGASDPGGSILLSAELYTRGPVVVMVLCGVLALQPVQAFDWVARITWSKAFLLLVLFILSLNQMLLQAYNPFLYFQF